MKYILSIIFLLICLNTECQSLSEFSISFSNKTIPEVINQIEKKTKIDFFFLDDWFDDRLVSGNYVNQTLDLVLTDIFKNTVINYYIYDDNRIILTENNMIDDSISSSFFEIIPKEDRINNVIENNEVQVVFNSKYDVKAIDNPTSFLDTMSVIKIGKEAKVNRVKLNVLRGVITDKSGEPLPNVAVMVKGGNIGTQTSSDGSYE